ncbi:unnamed protein product [Pedinophyceae sp. YPF-701]|nr:unnamed protein product [Pedinophyceae sp. YPF-701]
MRSERPDDVPFDEAHWQRRLTDLREGVGGAEELVVEERLGRDGAQAFGELAQRMGLYFRAYGKGTRTRLVASTVPLPAYRPDLDERATTEADVGMSRDAKHMVSQALAELEESNVAAGGGRGAAPQPPGKRPKAGASSRYLEFGADGGEALSRALEDAQRAWAASSAGQRMQQHRERLPAWARRAELLAAVARHQVVVVSGETGCGKTTQLPQFVLEDAVGAGRGGDVNIVCTQPRRISAVSVAQRVADERGEAIGDTVGYQIRLEARRSSKTRLLFCTTGVLLRRLVADKDLRGVTHVVVDEIHERGINEDFLLIVLRDLLPRRPDLRVILMSATLNADLFSNYFGHAPTAHIPGFTHPVEDLFLEDVLQLAGPPPASQQPPRSQGGPRRHRDRNAGAPASTMEPNAEGCIDREWRYEPDAGALAAQGYSSGTCDALARWAGVFNEGQEKSASSNAPQAPPPDLGLVQHVVEHICNNEAAGAVLVFLPGWAEISNLQKDLESRLDRSRNKIYPLHGSLPTANQREIFDRPPSGVRKVVLATNIAETSITIDDVVYVVDTGLIKEKRYSALNKLSSLLPQWASQAAARQRRGRAGRVQPGRCFKLYPRAMHDEAMAPYQAPEMTRTSLEEICLQIKSLDLGEIEPFLARALQPPEPRAVHNAKELLVAIGALEQAAEALTPLGQHLAHLPVDPLVGKMIIMGAMFGVVGPILTIAAGMAHRDPFVLPPPERRAEAAERRKRLSRGSCSDHVTLVHAFEGWRAAGGYRERSDFCWRNYMRSNTMELMVDLRLQFAELLADVGFLPVEGRGAGKPSRAALEKAIDAHSFNADNVNLLRAVICAGMYPNVVSVRQKHRMNTQFATTDDGKVEPHPSSVLVKEFLPHRWLVYSDKVMTSGIYLLASTMVSDYALLLMGGELKHEADGTISMHGGYIRFNTAPEVDRLIVRLRSQLQAVLARKVADPGLDIDGEAGALVRAVVALLDEEEGREEVVGEGRGRGRGGRGMGTGGR